MNIEILYSLFSESNDCEGETWLVFVKEDNNREFIEKMKAGIEIQNKQSKQESIIFCAGSIPKSEVDVLLKYDKFSRCGYNHGISVCDFECDADKVDITDAYTFYDSTYKMECYNLKK